MHKRASFYDWLVALVGGLNLLFVIFDFTYLRFRDYYLDLAPVVQIHYDTLKGIEPHRDTEAYIAEYEELKANLQNGGDAKERTRLMESLTQKARDMIDKSPFSAAGKDGALEVIKKRMREHFGKEESGKKAFGMFFSEANLSPDRYVSELEFFDTRIKPILRRNYFRHIGEDGEYLDLFYLCDMGFVIFFWLDFLFRWAVSVLRGTVRRWYLFPVLRGFEIFNLILPHHDAWVRLLRFIPYYIRLREAKILSGGGLMPGIIQDNAAVIADEISDKVMVNIISQAQNMLRAQKPGDIASSKPIAEIRALLESQTDVIAAKVVPQLTRDITELVIYSLNRALEPYLFSPVGFFVRFGMVSVNASVREGLKAALTDQEGVERMKTILRKSADQAVAELAAKENVGTLQVRVDAILEDLKTQIREQNG